VGGVPEVLGEDRGLLVDRESPGPLADAMRRLMSDPSLGETLGRRAREYALEEHGVDRMTEKYLEVFEKVI
jgi:glycosyltransferase involved in cell wall biosynthesis